MPASHAYALYVVVLVLTAPITCFVATETPLVVAEPVNLTCSVLLEIHTITPASHGGFFWVFVMRLLYYLAISSQVGDVSCHVCTMYYFRVLRRMRASRGFLTGHANNSDKRGVAWTVSDPTFERW